MYLIEELGLGETTTLSFSYGQPLYDLCDKDCHDKANTANTYIHCNVEIISGITTTSRTLTLTWGITHLGETEFSKGVETPSKVVGAVTCAYILIEPLVVLLHEQTIFQEVRSGLF